VHRRAERALLAVEPADLDPKRLEDGVGVAPGV